MVKTHKALKTLEAGTGLPLKYLKAPMPVLVCHLLVLLRIAASVVKDFRILVLKMSEEWWCPCHSSTWEAESGVELNPKPVWFTGEL